MPKIAKTCVVCGVVFEVWPNREHSAKTCSKDCKGKLFASQISRTYKSCAVCGKTFTAPPSIIHRMKTCSRDCANENLRRAKQPTGSDHFNWRGGKPIHADGYVYASAHGHPFGAQGKYVLEHRMIMEEWMRDKAPHHRFMIEMNGILYLRPEIEVHHINEDKRDNSIRNLLACTASAHRSIHHGSPPMKGEVWPDVEGMVEYTPSVVTCTCLVCGATFKKKRSDVKRGSGKYCTRECYKARPREAFKVITI